jgi:hypothetical protein
MCRGRPGATGQKKQHLKSVRQTVLPPLGVGERERPETVTIVGRQRANEDTGPVAYRARYEQDHPIGRARGRDFELTRSR